MTTPDHPRYPNPTIQEALCEFRLKPSSQTDWNPKRPGEILGRLDIKRFPGMEPVNELRVELVLDQSGQAQQRIVQGPQKIRYSSDDGTRMVQVSPVVYCFNSVRSYPGWDEFREAIIENWNIVHPFLNPERIERVGLRYINRIPLSAQYAKISDWLRPNKYIPAGISDSLPGSKYRFESKISETDIIIVSLVAQSDNKGIDCVFFDIDRGSSPHNLPDELEIRATIAKLHDDVWDVFSSAKTDLLEDYLAKEPTK